MYYELYVDVLFLVNFMMDYILLLLLRKMLSCTATQGRLILAALAGSFLTCVVILLPLPYISVKFILFHIVINTFMIRTGLKIKTFREFLKAYFLLYIGGFLLGGVMQFFQQYIRTGSMFFMIAVGGYYAVSKIWDFICNVQRIKQYHCQVELYVKEQKHQLKGIIDTGNSLCDPLTKEPVSILDKTVAKQLWGELDLQSVRYIPYHSIGKTEGVLLAIRIDRMCVCRETEYWVETPLIGISEETVSSGDEYQMILNPKIF